MRQRYLKRLARRDVDAKTKEILFLRDRVYQLDKTPAEIAALAWEITRANLSWGRIRIANQLKLLNIFLSASTVRNILQRPKPRGTPLSR